MVKKNPYIFTIGFNSSLPDHVRAAEILNGSGEKAQLIADAVLSYLKEKEEATSGITISAIQPLVQSLIQKELQKALKDSQKAENVEEAKEVSEAQERVFNLTQEQELPMDEQLTKNIVNAMSAFRKMK